jgi:hypothetical protein
VQDGEQEQGVCEGDDHPGAERSCRDAQGNQHVIVDKCSRTLAPISAPMTPTMTSPITPIAAIDDQLGGTGRRHGRSQMMLS